VYKAFGPLPVGEKQLQRLLTYSQQVLPIQYYECPIGWDEYTSISDDDMKRSGVLWVTDDGNFCAPAGQGEESKRVDPYSDEAPIRSLNDQVVSLTRKIAMNLPEGDELRKKAMVAEAARTTQKSILTDSKAAEKVQRTQQAENDILRIFRVMPEYENTSESSLKLLAKEYLAKAATCAAKNLEEKVGDACAAEPDCFTETDPYGKRPAVCVPSALNATVQSALDNVDTPEERVGAERLANWWSDYYTDFTAEQKAKKQRAYNLLTRHRR
jgi:hypothetical protein